MTRLLEQAIAAVSKLPDAEQDALARALLDEIGADERWDARFAQSAESLAELADDPERAAVVRREWPVVAGLI